MPVPLKYAVFPISLGWVAALASDRGLMSLTLPCSSGRAALQSLGDRAAGASLSPGAFSDLVGRLTAYFAGKYVLFDDPLDLEDGTPFQRLVWEAARQVPFGETRSYGWIAALIGHPAACRAAGSALGRNPLPVIIPCHRITGSDGGLCGYAGGLEMKKLLLDLERLAI